MKSRKITPAVCLKALAQLLVLIFFFATNESRADTALFTKVYLFTGGLDGSEPQASLIQASDGNFYSTAYDGGSNGVGTIFRVSPDLTVSPIYSFTGGNDGANPRGGLVQASDGNLYGTTESGGSNQFSGTVYKITTNGQFHAFYSFTGDNDGAHGEGSLVQAADGNLYGVTSDGGTNSRGTIFRLTTNGVFTSIYSFTGGNDGSSPQAGLTRASDGNLYGTASTGGSNFSGTIFRFNTAGNGHLTPLYSFTGGNDGSDPEAGMIQASDGNLYGTATSDSIFKITTNGVFSTVFTFTDGSTIRSSLLQANDGDLYGMTFFGGAFQNGSIFKITTNGDYEQFYSFDGTNDGMNPEGGLLQTSDGTFYGTSFQGGPAFIGTLFSFLVFPQPTNDNFANRRQLLGTDSGFDFGASLEPAEPAPDGGVADITNTIWWTWVAPTNGPVSIVTTGSSVETLIDVYKGSTLAGLTSVASNLTTVIGDEVNSNLLANAGISNRLNFNATAGTPYQVQVSSLNPGFIDIAAQTTAIKVLSFTLQPTNSDGSTPFTATVQVGNSGLITPGPLQVQVVAHAGVTFNTEPPDGPPDSSLLPQDQLLSTIDLANPSTVAPGATSNILISGTCPGPTSEKEFPFDPTNTLGFRWGIFAVLNEQFGVQFFFDDSELVFYGQPPVVGINQGPQAGVIRLNPSVSGSTPVFQTAQLNGPLKIAQNTTNNYFGIATFLNGASNVLVNFTNTAWTSSKFFISNGVFQTGSVVSNTPVTLTALFSYNYYGVSITNTNHLSLLVLRSPNPMLTGISSQANRGFQFELASQPSTKFVLQATTNLTQPTVWTPLSTNSTDSNGNLLFLDAGATNHPRRFYRAMQTN